MATDRRTAEDREVDNKVREGALLICDISSFLSAMVTHAAFCKVELQY